MNQIAVAAGRPAGRSVMTSDTGAPGPGWYPDPWFTGQHRFWDGRVWTGDVFPHGPVSAGGAGPDAPQVVARPVGERPPTPPPTTRSTVAPPPPTWAYAAHPSAPPTATAVIQPWELIESGSPERPARRLTTMQINALALAAGLVLGFVIVYQVVSHHGHKPAAAVPAPFFPQPAPLTPAPSPSAPQSTDRAAGLLQGLVVRQQDVRPGNQVQLLTGGNQVSGETTLDLCNGTYPSESLRTARLQVVEYDTGASSVLSTEAVLYRQPADAAQAMHELQTVAAACPNDPVVSPVHEPTVTTQFGAAPDKSWPAVDGVQRQAYSFTTTDDLGSTNDNIAVYLRRGRVLEGLYFPQPGGDQPPVQGQTSIANIVHLFEERIAALPASAIGG